MPKGHGVYTGFFECYSSFRIKSWNKLFNELGFNIVLDVGADIKADEQDLLQFALMGLNYARRGLKISRPRIGLLLSLIHI